jgi:hypothetical protein
MIRVPRARHNNSGDIVSSLRDSGFFMTVYAALKGGAIVSRASGALESELIADS